MSRGRSNRLRHRKLPSRTFGATPQPGALRSRSDRWARTATVEGRAWPLLTPTELIPAGPAGSGRARPASAARGRRRRRTRARTLSMRKSSMATPRSTSSQVTGVETGGAGSRAHGVDGGQRAAPGVLVVVDEHAACAAARATRYSAVMSVGSGRARPGASALANVPDLLLRRAAHDGHVDVDAARAGGLRDSWACRGRPAPRARTSAVSRTCVEAAAALHRDRGRSAGSRGGPRRRSGRTTG